MSASKLATWLTIAAGAIAIYSFIKSRKACASCSSGSSSLAAATTYVDYQ